MGVSSRENIKVYGAYRKAYNFMGGQIDLIEWLLELVGPMGILLCPAMVQICITMI